MSKIVCFKLISGDEVVGELVPSTLGSKNITLRKPFIVLASQQGVGLIPVMLTARENESVEFKDAALATCPIEVIADFEKHYLEKTTSIKLLT